MNNQVGTPVAPMAFAEPISNNDYMIGTRQELAIQKKNNHIRNISIEQLDHGYIVRVGCQSFAIENLRTVIKNIEQYMINPDDVEDKYLKGEFKI